MQFGLSEAVAHWGRYRPDRSAVLANGKLIPYRRLNQDVDHIVPWLFDDPASRAAVACGSKYASLVAMLAILRSGKSVVVLNTGLGDRVLRTNLEDAGVELLLHDGHFQDIEQLIRERKGRLINSTTLGDREPVSPRQRSRTDEWGVLYSSGTTGTPKGIERDHDSMVTEFLGWVLELGLNRDTNLYIGRPIYYTGGLVLAGAILLAGGTVAFDDLPSDNDPKLAWEALTRALEKTEIDLAFFVPDQLRAFLKSKRSLPGTRAPGNVLVMGASITGDEKVAVSRLFRCGVIESWGNSESLGTITEPEDLESRPNSIGRPFVSDELLIVDEKLGRLPENEQGRIAGAVEAGFSRYSNRPEATSEVLRDGLIVSEDYGYEDEYGYFYIVGRLSDQIVRNGKTIFLSKIEAHIRSMESIEECCVTSSGDEGCVEVVAIVASTQHTDPESLRKSLNASLGKEESIDRLLLTDLPKVPSGKIDRLGCKRLAARGADA